uniref:Integrin alpha-2 domain-containing protein n=1 Tax=Pygocentrus nattereri TaxID=42514 RepID=A0AAR2J3V0_PYGNA
RRLTGLLLVIFSVPISAFNLDTTDTLNKEGELGSFFGFSLALHQQLSPQPKSWLLVGAPRARGLGTLRNSHPGALYRCPITAEEYDCERVDIDGDVSLERESKDNQWLGVTVKSQGIGGKVVTCAHLYELRQRVNQPSETRDPIGRCYMLSEDLTERDDLDGGEWKFCEGRSQGHEQFGFCQQGLAASFTPDNNYVLFGAPGTYNWKGEMRVQHLNQSLVDLGFYDDGPYEIADEKRQNATLIPVPYHSYLGFSVDSAKGIMSRGELTFVAGAPRANHTGAVVLLKKDNVYRLVPKFILWGEELASSFGYSVTTTDLNKDGWTDLIVGAPNFFDRKAEIGGAVYVFLNPASHWEKARPIRLNGTYDSMFGMTVSSVGDLDQDGYGDVAVGAPFDGDGKVFIFRGSATGIDTKPSQVLDGLNAGVKRFGYSISGGLDIDGNLYPDLAVGSLSDQVVLYRSRPVVHVSRDISLKPQQIDLAQQNCKGRDGSQFLLCPHLCVCFVPALAVHFEADTERRKLGLPHRVHFLGRTASEPEYVHSKEVELRGQNHPACQTATFVLQENIRDKLRPISLAITHTIKKTRHQDESSAVNVFVLLSVFRFKLCFQVNFLREGCGEDKICQSNLKLSCQFGTRAPISDLFTPLPLDEDGVPVFSLSDQRSVVLEVTITNMPSDPKNPQEDGDDAHAAQMLVTLPSTLSYSGFRGQQVRTQRRVVCQANQNGSQAECELGNPVRRDAMLKFYIILSTSDITIETTSLAVDLLMSTVGNVGGVVLRLARPHQLFFSGMVRGESAMKTLDDVGSEVEYEFMVTNTGQSVQTVGSAFLNIMWPYELANGKWLLYPSSLKIEGHPHSHCTHLSALNPRGLSSTEPHSFDPLLKISLRISRSQNDDCLLGSARCVLFQCPLHSFSGTALFKIRGRLWNSTFIEVPWIHLLCSYVFFSNFIFLSLLCVLIVCSLVSLQVPVMIYPEHGISDQYWIPWWIILIAILAGVLVLALLVCILWKCGFFRRAQYKDKVPQYHAVKIPRQERSQFQDEKSIILHKKEWATHWTDGTS